MADIVRWYGQSGLEYLFELFPVGTTFNPVSAIYIFCSRVSPTNWTALYVGESESLHDRLNTGITQHSGFKRATLRGATHIAVMRTYDKSERLRIETDLRHGLKPVCNLQGTETILGSLFR